jgi:hypothetical protein
MYTWMMVYTCHFHFATSYLSLYICQCNILMLEMTIKLIWIWMYCNGRIWLMRSCMAINNNNLFDCHAMPMGSGGVTPHHDWHECSNACRCKSKQYDALCNDVQAVALWQWPVQEQNQSGTTSVRQTCIAAVSATASASADQNRTY